MKGKLNFLLLCFFLVSSQLFASHYMGGEITWECLGNGYFRFTMKLYRECNGITYSSSETLNIANYPGLSSIQMNLKPGANPRDGDDGLLDGKTDISPSCFDPAQEIKCNPSPSIANTGAIEEWYYTSDVAYPSGVMLNGVPPAAGWIFSHDGCCRNPSTNMVGATSSDWFLRAIMYPFQGRNTYPCYDNSPVFAEVPSTVICTGYPFKYNHNASDKELDSLAFAWAPALQSAYTPMGYTATYSFNSPLPGTAQNPLNVPATINPYNGEISYTSYTNGAFVTVTKVTAYRCGIKIAEIFREMQIVLLACPGSNTPPNIRGPFFNPVTGLYEYTDTVYAGEVVDVDIVAIDYGTLPNGNPQMVTLEASGLDFGAGFINQTSGCPRPPCATLNPTPTLSAMLAVSTHFHWQTSCDHLTHPASITGIPGICGTLFNVHTFVIKAYDDFCPAPGIQIATISIVVLPVDVLPPPEIKCTEVGSNGDITLTWVPPPDPHNTFNSYHVYYSNSPTGPFNRIDSIFTYSQTSKTYTGLGGNSGPRYFYMTTRSGCYGKYFSTTTSDTVSTIYLTVNPLANGSVAELLWNPVHNPLAGSSSQWYHIYREFPAGSWNLLDSTTMLTYYDTINICSAFINYRIEISDTTGCTSISSVDGEQFYDDIPPNPIFLDSVTVDATSGKASLGWQASTSPDAVKYYIYHKIGAAWFIIDSVDVPATTYVDITSTPQSAPESYCIAAVDSCKKLSPMSPEHRTICLSPPVINACADKVSLKWSSYIHFKDPGLKGYRLMISENAGPYTILADLSTADSSYEHVSLVNGHTYCYYVQAYDSINSKTSSSNRCCVLVTKPNQPKFIYLRYATVKNDEFIRLGFYVDTTAYISRYKVLRSADGISYDTIALLPPTNIYSNVLYDDNTADVHSGSYYYKVVVADSCFLDVLTSNTGRTIYLQGDATDYLYNRIDWNLYEDRLPVEYNILREVEDFQPYTKVQTFLLSETTFTEDVTNFTESGGRFKYTVQAPLNDIYNTDLTFIDTVYSNEVLLLQPSRLYVPNAFFPDGLNNIFKPIGVFTDKDNYQMVIYDRWGQTVFETTDYEQGWDGTMKGKRCPYGVYTYCIKITNAFNKSFLKRGIVTLIR